MNNTKRTQTLGLHSWTKDDLTLCFYYTKYGIKNLYYNTEKQISDFIGTSVVSLKKQSMNFRFLMGKDTQVLSDYSKLQKEVFENLNGLGQLQVLDMVKKIINQDELVRMDLFKKLGKDVSKYRLVGVE